MMNQFEEIFMRLGIDISNVNPISPEEQLKHKVDAYNSSEGNLKGYDCKLCNNRGSFAKIDDEGYYRIYPCKCQKIRETLRRARKSGLGDVITEMTFNNFIAEKEWQKTIKHRAIEFCKDDSAHWFFIGGQVGCVDADTEYFDGSQWRKISEYRGGHVLQYEPETKKATLTDPKRYIEAPAETLYKITTKRGSIDQVLSENHNFAYVTSKGHMKKKPFYEVLKMHKDSVQGFYGKVETAFSYDGGGIDLTDNEIRLMCAVIADGYFNDRIHLCTVNIKKERKKKRLRELLSGMKYRENKRKDGYSQFRFYAPRREKVFSSYWYGCNKHQLEIIADEVFYWDGSIDKQGRHFFFSTDKNSADFVQFAASATGKRATISTDKRQGKPVCYIVCVSSNRSTISMASTGGKNKAKITEYKPVDGKQYCFEVDTGYLVLRRNDRIFITGNSGKSHICTAISAYYIKAGRDMKYMVWSEESKKLKSVVNDLMYQDLIDEYRDIDVLYIDDFLKVKGGENPTAADINLAFEIINHRIMSNDKVTIISSEKTLDDLMDYDEATMSRIYQKCGKYKLNISKDRSKNYRLCKRSDVI